MRGEDVLGEVPPVRTEVERDLFAVVEQARAGTARSDARAERSDRLGAHVAREQRRLVAVVGIVGIEVLGHEEAPGALGEREPVDQRVVLRDRGARRAGAPARGRARSRAPTTGTRRAAKTRGSSRPREYTSPNAGADGADHCTFLGRGRPCSRARRRARVATSIRAGSMRRRMRSASSSAASCASAKRHPARERHPQPIPDQRRLDVLAAPGAPNQLDLHLSCSLRLRRVPVRCPRSRALSISLPRARLWSDVRERHTQLLEKFFLARARISTGNFS